MEELARDLDPAHRDAVTRILETWKEGGESEDELRRLLGKRMTKKMLAKLNDVSR